MSAQLLAFVEEQATKLTPDDITALASRLPALRERFSRIGTLEYPHLAEQYEFLSLLVEDCSAHVHGNLSEACDREVAFALLYLENRGDLLPDDVPGVGLTDDEAVVASVLHKHGDALRKSPRGYLFHWEAGPVDFDQMLLDRLHRRLGRMREDGLKS